MARFVATSSRPVANHDLLPEPVGSESVTVALLNVQQASFNELSSQNLMVGRVSAKVLAESTVGLIFTQGDPTSDRNNSLVGADFLFLDSNGLADQILRGKAWVQQTETEVLTGDSLAYGLGLSFPNDRFRAEVDFLEIQENFNPALDGGRYDSMDGGARIASGTAIENDSGEQVRNGRKAVSGR